MTVSLKHAFTSAKSDGADSTLVQPSNWNAEHTLSAAAASVLGRDTSGAGTVQELPIAVDTSGNVGIGTNSPDGKLDVTGTNGSVRVNSSGDQIAFTYNGFNYITASGAAATLQTQASGASGKLIFATAGAERLRIASTGFVGVGQNSPAATFDVNGAAAQNAVAVSASAVDCATGNYFTKTASGALTWTFTNVPASRAFIFALQLTNGGSGTQTWPAAVAWDGGTAPTLQTSGTDILVFTTADSGTTWRGVRAWKQA